jgi:hypothetical protein
MKPALSKAEGNLAFRPVHGEILRFAQNDNPCRNELYYYRSQ